MSGTNWSVVLRDPNSVAFLDSFVRGERGLRSVIENVQNRNARTELYRLERRGAKRARNVVRRALRERAV